jgi:hypothetical protein
MSVHPTTTHATQRGGSSSPRWVRGFAESQIGATSSSVVMVAAPAAVTRMMR